MRERVSEDYKCQALNSLLIKKEFNEDVSFIFGKENFKSKNSVFSCFYLHKELLDEGIKSIKIKLNAFLNTVHGKTRQTHNNSKKNNLITSVASADSVIQVRYSEELTAKHILEQVITKLRTEKKHQQYHFHDSINSNINQYAGKHLNHKFSHIDESDDLQKAKKKANWKGAEEISQHLFFQNTSQKGIPRYITDDGSEILFGKDILEAYPQFKDEEYLSQWGEFEKNFPISSRNIEYVFSEENGKSITTAKILHSEADSIISEFEKLKDPKNSPYTPKLHHEINDAHINVKSAKIEKGKLTDGNRAFGLLLWKRIILENIPRSDALDEIINSLAEIIKPEDDDTYFYKDSSTITDLLNLSIYSINMKDSLSINQAKAFVKINGRRKRRAVPRGRRRKSEGKGYMPE